MAKCSCCNAPSNEAVKALEARLDKALVALVEIRNYPTPPEDYDCRGALRQVQAIAKEGMK